jgi:hypothetical protein
MPSSRERFLPVSAFLRGDLDRWQDLRVDTRAFLDQCGEQDVSALVFERLSTLDSTLDWPEGVRESLSLAARTRAAEELLRGAEIRVVLDALAHSGVRPILIKGTPLAYAWYDSPASRPRDDTDLLVDEATVGCARKVMISLGYVETVHCSELFSQFEVQKRDRFGMVHAFDVHWRISAQPVFADVLRYQQCLPRAVPVPALGASAFALCGVDGLLLACVHPVMHHRNEARLLWVYDIHLLAARLTEVELNEFARMARERHVAEVCAHGLRLAQTTFGTPVDAGVVGRLGRQGGTEPSARYLASERRWHHEAISSVRALPLGARVRLLREVLLPSPHYMLGAYGLRGKALGAWLLPALYIHRNVRGALRILTGKK